MVRTQVKWKCIFRINYQILISKGKSIMSVIVNLQSKAKLETITELVSFIEEKLQTVRGFNGCLHVSICLNKSSGDLLFNEKWSSKEAHENYLLSIQNNGVMSQLIGYLSLPPAVTYFDKLDI